MLLSIPLGFLLGCLAYRAFDAGVKRYRTLARLDDAMFYGFTRACDAGRWVERHVLPHVGGAGAIFDRRN
jgi:hypothetical protein